MPEAKLTEYGLGLLAMLWGLLSWNGRNLARDVKEHGKTIADKVGREEFNNTIGSIRKSMEEHTERIFDKVDDSRKEQSDKLDKLTQAVYDRKK